MKKKIRIAICIFTLSLAAAFTGCGNRFSSANAGAGREAVSAIDQFLNGSLSASSTLEILEDCCDSVTDADGKDSVLLRTYINNASVAVFEHAVVLTSGMDYGDANVVDKRNDLAELVGMAER
jgi:hypothetical protein